MNIQVNAVFPPVPSRSMDYVAVDDDTYDGGRDIGYGPTPMEAVFDWADAAEVDSLVFEGVKWNRTETGWEQE